MASLVLLWANNNTLRAVLKRDLKKIWPYGMGQAEIVRLHVPYCTVSIELEQRAKGTVSGFQEPFSKIRAPERLCSNV
jgi:hypothetical protein